MMYPQSWDKTVHAQSWNKMISAQLGFNLVTTWPRHGRDFALTWRGHGRSLAATWQRPCVSWAQTSREMGATWLGPVCNMHKIAIRKHVNNRKHIPNNLLFLKKNVHGSKKNRHKSHLLAPRFEDFLESDTGFEDFLESDPQI
jgi:hypothetical protein